MTAVISQMCLPKEAAQILAANGIKVYLFEELKPVP